MAEANVEIQRLSDEEEEGDAANGPSGSSGGAERVRNKSGDSLGSGGGSLGGGRGGCGHSYMAPWPRAWPTVDMDCMAFGMVGIMISPCQLNPTQPNSIRLNPTQPDSTQLNPTQSNSIQLNPTQSDSIQLNPTQSNSIQLNPTQSSTYFPSAPTVRTHTLAHTRTISHAFNVTRTLVYSRAFNVTRTHVHSYTCILVYLYTRILVYSYTRRGAAAYRSHSKAKMWTTHATFTTSSRVYLPSCWHSPQQPLSSR